MNILTENEINIKSLEKEIYDYACRLAAKTFANYLESLDQELMKSRDKELLRHKGYRKTCIKTLMGEVEYSRTVYQVMDNEREKKFVYLLDEYVGFENIGFISANLVERIADNICETSYEQTAKNISSLGVKNYAVQRFRPVNKDNPNNPPAHEITQFFTDKEFENTLKKYVKNLELRF